MAASCALNVPSGGTCEVPAVGRCVECNRAFCRSHRIDNRRCADHPAVQRRPGQDRFDIEYAGPHLLAYESRAREFIARTVQKYLSLGGMVTLESFRHQMDLGERRPMWLSDGTYNESPVTDGDFRRDTFAWAAIREGLRVELFTTGSDEVDQQLLGCEVDEPMVQEYLSVGGNGRVIYPHEGPLIPDYNSVSGIRRDVTYYRNMIESSKSRQPSRGFVEAFAAFYGPLDDEQRQLQELPAASPQALTEYLAHGTGQDPDEWGRMHRLRLVPVDWPALAAALTTAGVPQKGRFFGPSYRTMFGRWKPDEVCSWIVNSHPREHWNGTFDEGTLQLLGDGSLVDGSGGKAEVGSGKVSPERMRQIALRNNS